MSFTANIKEEVTRLEGNVLEYLAELSCIIRNNATIKEEIIITVENNAVARRIFKLIKSARVRIIFRSECRIQLKEVI